MTERSTCRRVAPSVRSVASSRVRCATVIDSVLKMTNAPTKSAMPPKPSRKPRMKLMKLPTDFLSCARLLVRRLHLGGAGDDRAELAGELVLRDALLRGDGDRRVALDLRAASAPSGS